MRGIGIDFGTTNSAIACVRDDGEVRLARFGSGAGERDYCRSILFFDARESEEAGRPLVHAGPSAIDRYLAAGGHGRLMQSLKSFLASDMVATSVFGHSYSLEQLVAVILRELRLQAELQLGGCDGPIVVGRPVHFAWADGPDGDARAERRLREALVLAGFPQVELAYEPVGAAHQYEARLDHEELVLVADLGGGTSDFCLLRLGPRAAEPGEERILGTGGVGIGGDSFDATIVHELVAPELGRGGQHRSALGKLLPNPAWLYTQLSRWHQLSVLKTPESRELLENLERLAIEPRKIRRLIELVENDLGYALYVSVERSKVAVSAAPDTTFSFEGPLVKVDVPLARESFEGWIGAQLVAVGACLDRLLAQCSVGTEDVDAVFLTGGSALVPAVQQILVGRFGADRIRSGDFLVSVASGLARRAAG